MNFIPLHVTTSYSLLSSPLRLEDLFVTLKENSINTCGIADKNLLLGYTHFNSYCKKNNVNQIFGMDIEIDNNYLSLYIKNEVGYQNLIKISYLISKYEKNIDLDTLKKYSDGLICVISTNESNIFLKNKNDWASFLKSYSIIFKDDFYIGLEFYKESKNIKDLHDFLKKYPYNFIAFPHIKYIKKEDALTLKILDCIKNHFSTHLILNPQNDKQNDELDKKYYFRNINELLELYTEQELLNINFLVSKINFDFDIKRGKLLLFNEKINSKELLQQYCLKGLKNKNLQNNKTYIDRLNYELDVINKMGYNDYFLIVQDYVNYAKNKDIIVAPGRGSAAGSLVSYLLNITEVDPIKYNLLFERFLNIKRVSMPDIDIDFENDKRDEVINYLKEKYGQEKVSQIITIQTFKAKQAIRDIGRVYQENQQNIDIMAKSITNDKLSLEESKKSSINLAKLLEQDDDYYGKIFELAKRIENLPRQLGIHAAGIILNNESIIKNLPIIYNKDVNFILTQFEMNSLEKQGFLKMDLLALTNLSTIHNILNLIKENQNIDINFSSIPIDDPLIFKEIINKNLTTGIFQIESDGINQAISLIKPSCFNDVVATIALFRPGPMDSIKDYAERKQKIKRDPNYKINYYTDELKEILSETYGIIIYQEQIMQICQKVASFTLSKADIFRRAISKKNKEDIEILKNEFINGCIKNNYSKEVANNLYNLIEKFAGYGFNKSHSVSYSMITCKMAYLKLKYPKEFYIALLQTINNSNDFKFYKYIQELNQLNLKFNLPNINDSEYVFSLKNNNMIMPFSAIKGLTSDTISKILFERKQNGNYKNILDFFVRTHDYRISTSQYEKLIQSGCFDKFIPNRQAILNKLKICIQYADILLKTGPLVSMYSEEQINFDLNTKEDKFKKIIIENELLGLFISDNPINHTIKEANIRFKNKITSISLLKNNLKEYYLNVFILKNRILRNKNIMFLTVIDQNNDSLECVIFKDTFEKINNKYNGNLNIYNEHNILVIKGKYQVKNFKPSFIISNLEPMEFKNE